MEIFDSHHCYHVETTIEALRAMEGVEAETQGKNTDNNCRGRAYFGLDRLRPLIRSTHLFM